MELKLTNLEDVWTKDGKHLGQAYKLYHRTDGVDPGLKLYASYLKVVSFESGNEYYIPTDFIAGRDPETNRVMLLANMKQVMEETWSRMPDFVARGESQKETLPQKSPALGG